MKILFIVGTGRCGSSLIHEIMARHENTGFISNIDDNLPFMNMVGRWNNRIFRSFPGKWTAKGGLRFAPSEAYNIIARKISGIYSSPCRDLHESDVTPWLEKSFTTFFNMRYRAQGKLVFLHKYTGWSRIGFFSKIFPEAKFIHIVRDGRAVANSWLQMPWWNGYRGPENWLWGNLPQHYLDEWNASNKSFIRLAAINWKLLMESYECSSLSLPNTRYLQLRYEDFLENPHEQLKHLMDFAGLAWSGKFGAHLNKQPLNSNRKNAYLYDLSSDQLAELELSLHDKLVKYGYPVKSA